MATSLDLIKKELFSIGIPLDITGENDFINSIKQIETERNKKLISKCISYIEFDFSDLTALECYYFNVKGFIDCANQLFWITDEEHNKINHILLSYYMVESIKSESKIA